MDRIDAMALFVACVEEGSFAGAARRARISAAGVTRAVASLEARTGHRLLHRSARGMRLTDAGETLLATCREALATLRQGGLAGEAAAGVPSAAVEGRLGLTAPVLFGRIAVLPVLGDFLAAHPAARARALLLDRPVDLIEEGIDCAVRLAPLPDSRMVAVRLGAVRRLTLASPGYLRRAGRPADPSALARHHCVGSLEAGTREAWRFDRRPSGARAPRRAWTVAVEPRLALNGAAGAIEAALRGEGICRALSYQVEQAVADGRLVRLLDAFEPAPLPVQLVFHPIPARRVALRAFVDHAVPRLRAFLDRAALAPV